MAPLNKKITKKASGATRNRTGDTRPRIFSDQSFALPIHIKVFNIPKNNSLYKVFITQKRESFRRTTLFTWCHQESNRGHKDFQSFALPTELWHLADLRVQRYYFEAKQPNFKMIKFKKLFFSQNGHGYFSKIEQFCK